MPDIRQKHFHIIIVQIQLKRAKLKIFHLTHSRETNNWIWQTFWNKLTKQVWVLALSPCSTWSSFIDIHELAGKSSSMGTRNWRHPFQCPSRSIRQMRLNIRINIPATLKNCKESRERSPHIFAQLLPYTMSVLGGQRDRIVGASQQRCFWYSTQYCSILW